MDAMRARHEALLRRAHDLIDIRVSSLFPLLSGRPLLLPIYICAYRYGNRTFRVVINGQTGELTGRAPISWWRVALATAMVLGIVVLVRSGLGIIGAIGAHR